MGSCTSTASRPVQEQSRFSDPFSLRFGRNLQLNIQLRGEGAHTIEVIFPPSLFPATSTHAELVGLILNSNTSSGSFPLPSQIPFDELFLQLMVNSILMTSNINPHLSDAGLSPGEIENLTRVTIDQDVGECGITLDKFNIGETAIVLPCSHVYKEIAIVEWLRQQGTCPVCRRRV